MPLPESLLRRNPRVHKNQFGHVLVLAGSRHMLGAAALTGSAAMRSGAGLVTIGISASLNETLQKKIPSVLMTLSFKETRDQTLSESAFEQIKKIQTRFNVIAVGPGLSTHPSTKKLVLKIIAQSTIPLVIDADALNCLAGHLAVLKKTSTPKILTPHPGEMARLVSRPKEDVEKHRSQSAENFAKLYRCVLLLKGHRTVIASADGRIYVNRTGNAGMATAGSGDVLTGMIAAFLAQGLKPFEAAKWGAYIHGKAGDLAARAKSKISLIASDIIDSIPEAMKRLE